MLALRILNFKKDVASLPGRAPQAMRRAAGRREFALSTSRWPFASATSTVIWCALGRSEYFQDRISSILDAHLAAGRTQLNSVMKVLHLLQVFMPLTVVTGMWGMNIPLPNFRDERPVRVVFGS